jgi:hypothetical protein
MAVARSLNLASFLVFFSAGEDLSISSMAAIMLLAWAPIFTVSTMVPLPSVLIFTTLCPWKHAAVRRTAGTRARRALRMRSLLSSIRGGR